MVEGMKFSWFQKFVIGCIVKEGEKRMLNLSKNTATTLLGICMILGALGNAGIAILDGDPATNFNWQVTAVAVGAGFTAIKAREQSQHEKEQKEKL